MKSAGVRKSSKKTSATTAKGDPALPAIGLGSIRDYFSSPAQKTDVEGGDPYLASLRERCLVKVSQKAKQQSRAPVPVSTFSEADLVKSLTPSHTFFQDLLPFLGTLTSPCSNYEDGGGISVNAKASPKCCKTWFEFYRYVEPMFLVPLNEQLAESIRGEGLPFREVVEVRATALPAEEEGEGVKPDVIYTPVWYKAMEDALDPCPSSTTTSTTAKVKGAGDWHRLRVECMRQVHSELPRSDMREGLRRVKVRDLQLKLVEEIERSQREVTGPVWARLLNTLAEHGPDNGSTESYRQALETLKSFALTTLKQLLFKQACDSLEEVCPLGEGEEVLCTFDDSTCLRYRKIPRKLCQEILNIRSGGSFYPEGEIKHWVREVAYAPGPLCHLCRTKGFAPLNPTRAETLVSCTREVEDWEEGVVAGPRVRCPRHYCQGCLKLFNLGIPAEGVTQWACPACEELCTGERFQRSKQILAIEQWLAAHGAGPMPLLDHVVPGELGLIVVFSGEGTERWGE